MPNLPTLVSKQIADLLTSPEWAREEINKYDIMVQLNVSKKPIERIRKLLGDKVPKQRAGFKQTLTSKEIGHIAKCYKPHEISKQTLATAYGVSRSTLDRALKNARG